jgi:transketolase N-terminal domain/subunit
VKGANKRFLTMGSASQYNNILIYTVILICDRICILFKVTCQCRHVNHDNFVITVGHRNVNIYIILVHLGFID